ncbi:hypothetical protein BaRGS_00019450 [Batillaria attramentaria]|uniref:Apple domain-containing protein n=1 Tax=Batillaria attramentaria TaxID=370345 RepID=A0ABD0KR37_9CAEN
MWSRDAAMDNFTPNCTDTASDTVIAPSPGACALACSGRPWCNSFVYEEGSYQCFLYSSVFKSGMGKKERGGFHLRPSDRAVLDGDSGTKNVAAKQRVLYGPGRPGCDARRCQSPSGHVGHSVARRTTRHTLGQRTEGGRDSGQGILERRRTQ